jgi:hypothetical protein
MPIRMYSQRHWLVIERLPAYAPDPQPGRGPVVQPQAVEPANLTGSTLSEVITQAHRGIQRVGRIPHLASSFLRRTACWCHNTPRSPDLHVRRPPSRHTMVTWDPW